MKRLVVTVLAITVVAGPAQLLADQSAAPETGYAQAPGPPGGTGGVIPPGGRLPQRNGSKPRPEGTNPGPLPPGSNGGPPPKERDQQMPKKLNPQNDPDVQKGWEKHQKERGK